MAEPASDRPPPPRLLLPTSHADLRMTWHAGRGLVISLWHGQECAASAPLSTEQAARVAGFMVDHLGVRAVAADPAVDDADPTLRLAVVDDREDPPGRE